MPAAADPLSSAEVRVLQVPDRTPTAMLAGGRTATTIILAAIQVRAAT